VRRLAILAAVLGVAALPGAALAKSRDPVERALPRSDHADRALYRRAKHALRRLHGPPRADLAGVVAATRSLARQGRLQAARAEAFLILRRNVEWYWDERRSAPPGNTRTAFDGSPVLFQRFPGSGWQLHPLANFARLNALIKSRSLTSARRLADDLLALLAPRGNALALEYLFPYLGGRAGWVSGMATATGMQALARLTRATGDPRYQDAAARMLTTLVEPPPIGVRCQLGTGRSHYLPTARRRTSSSAMASRRR
jgi:hypothetical protein